MGIFPTGRKVAIVTPLDNKRQIASDKLDSLVTINYRLLNN